MIAHTKPDLLPMELLEEVNLALSELLGCLSPADRMAQLSRAIGRAAARVGINDPAALCRGILERQIGEAALEELATELLPGETYFFRDPPTMNALQQEVLPRLLQERRGEKQLNVWSAACSTGEEPLTLAMLLRAVLTEMADWKIRILATDLRARALAAARHGSYREWSFRGCPGWIRERHFERHGSGAWTISPDILALVEYRQFNLVRDPFPPPSHPVGGFDLIVCRNVLIYLEPRRITSLLDRLHDCLAAGGWLLVAAVEAPAVNLEQYECVRFGESLFFRKRQETRMVPGTAAAAHDVKAAPASGRSQSHSRRREAGPSCGPDQAEKKVTTPRAHRAENQDAEQYQAQAAICLERGDLSTARDLLRRALYLDRHNAMTQLLQGRLCQAEGQNTRARRSYQAALKLLERLAPNQELDKDHHLTAAELAAMVRETLSGLTSQ